MIEEQSDGAVRFKVTSLYPLLYGSRSGDGSRGAGSRRRVNGGAATTGSPRPAGACSRNSGAAGNASSLPSIASSRCVMHDWKAEIIRRLGDAAPALRSEIVEEMAQHVESDIGRCWCAVRRGAGVCGGAAGVERLGGICGGLRANGAGAAGSAPAGAQRGEVRCGRPAGRPLCDQDVRQEARLHGHGAGDARARHRREHGDLFRGQYSDAAAAAVRRAGPPGPDLGEQSRRRLARVLRVASQLPGLARAGDGVRAPCRRHRRQLLAHLRQRGHDSEGHRRHRRLPASARRCASHGPQLSSR